MDYTRVKKLPAVPDAHGSLDMDTTDGACLALRIRIGDVRLRITPDFNSLVISVPKVRTMYRVVGTLGGLRVDPWQFGPFETEEEAQGKIVELSGKWPTGAVELAVEPFETSD